ncbi:MAG: glycine dehydrogenase (aminomethyl-transferring) [Omnitrophica bacterium RIFCSPLOWO2_12_FULL_44_17]|uniref:Probable glycine dehydrogenase (decarboxylating) subunit 2 n=1 Tax=Candidatus Danuiimicrobium aquiferis TaxID=1801832 RepID=A0A1G1KRP4_9BACT|nr:MAG: glycine dehydrogenase (aminomethyl-transferring) [Omnitrophica bacterium RIFCSPHIGHO2_02_FULL_45_28]OGW91229.1 MAG: glycine dehydrogenase (aminomethyl-transferring) [Omnitrophica bacterium RIFCSPHIGHO2_12_FULL_44_12]OGW95630.1 MAG: glycine dehydrogenase (aminomethyl-transferring) [Omnitrophica bacterium RIFCSPLOWO2_12_FULL_44_17]OGX03657.1 MAG: glycine dehydrogenase (aminomethyl-transferring) [Omnitrophica bacterium RIFCSPLOWO2_02_FULL_44_11]
MNVESHINLEQDSKLLFEKSKPGKSGTPLPKRKFQNRNFGKLIPQSLQRASGARLPQLTESELIRHFINLSRKNFSVDTHFYPLGSCTMKYNPKINEDIAGLEGFSWIHPYQDISEVQGMLRILHELSTALSEITGMAEVSLQPAAGAHGELTGMMITRAYHLSRGDTKRTRVLVPDSSHGTNPASAGQCGFEVVQIPSNARGRVDLIALEAALDDRAACLMLTNPNTLGLFEDDILQICEAVHRKGALLYYDGANLNALVGNLRPGDMGFDIIHLNLHKTFSTPHGCGGPGAGPVGVSKTLIPFLPVPSIVKKDGQYGFDYNRPASIGKVKSFYGNVGVLIRAYVYIRMLGLDGLKRVSHDAVVNANYLRKKLSTIYNVPYNDFCMHEFVISTSNFDSKGLHAGDFGKRLLDYGIHAPTVHFPLIVKEALMIEPTETESKEMLDRFVDVMRQIHREANESPDILKNAPYTTPISRPDEVLAARNPVLSFRDIER